MSDTAAAAAAVAAIIGTMMPRSLRQSVRSLEPVTQHRPTANDCDGGQRPAHL